MKIRDLRFRPGEEIGWDDLWCVSQPLHHPNTPRIVVAVSHMKDTPAEHRLYDIDRVNAASKTSMAPNGVIHNDLDKLELAAWLAEMIEAPGYPAR